MKSDEYVFYNDNFDIIYIVISIFSIILDVLGINFYGISLVWISILFCGVPIIIEAVINLLVDFDTKADVLVSVAIISSIIIGELFAAGIISIIMTIGEYLEEYTVSKTNSGIEKLINLSPTKATLVKNYNHADEYEKVISPELIEPGDVLKVVPGEQIPVDGIILSGESSIDQSVMTGESIPIDKSLGYEAYSGTINLYGSFYMKASKKGEDSSFQKLIELVESADPNNSEMVKAADRWASWMVLLAFSSAIITWFITGEIIRAVTILVVFCPCALVLATPTAITASLYNLTKYGILVKEGISIEKLAEINQIIFDKTGTLTYGKPTVTDIIVYDHSCSKRELINLLASLEIHSEHPLAKSITKFYKENYKEPLKKVNGFEMKMGKGIVAKLGDSYLYAGNYEFLEESNISIPERFIEENVSDALDRGSTVIYLGRDSEFLGLVLLADELRDNMAEMVGELDKLGVGSALLTGDGKGASKTIAQNAGICDLEYACLPEDKISKVRDFHIQDKKVAMVGDGINDAPSLKEADIGISMGGVGSDISIEASDVCLISDDIKHIPHLFALSRKTVKTIHICIAFSLFLNILATILAFFGILNPIAGALVHNIGSIVVILYSSLLLRFKYEY